MRKKYDIIQSAEEEFAREVALGVLVARPVSVWETLIPFMFIMDYLRRGSVVRLYVRNFMFPRKMAIDAALDINSGEDREKRLLRVEEAIKEWLNSLKLYSPGLHRNQMEVIALLIEHYSKLLNSDGDTYNSLVKSAYNNRGNYEAYLSRLVSLEKEVDRAIIEKLGETENLRQRLLAEQLQVEERRKMNVEETFLD
ncbi:MAG: NF038143 family protein [Thermodesulfovibrionia bacterium]